MIKLNTGLFADSPPPSSLASHDGQCKAMAWATDRYWNGEHTDSRRVSAKSFGPLKPALKRSSGTLHTDVRPAKSVSFFLEDCTDGHFKGHHLGIWQHTDAIFTRDQLEVMKQAVVMMGDHQEDVVQLVIDAHELLHESKCYFSCSEELCQRADTLTQNPLLQTELRERIKDLKTNPEHSEAEDAKTECGAADTISHDHRHMAAGSDHEDHVEEAICPPAGMSADGQLTFSSPSSASASSFPSTFSAFASSFSSSDTAYSAIAQSSTSVPPLPYSFPSAATFLHTVAALATAFPPSTLSVLAPSSSSSSSASPSSAAAHQVPNEHASSAMLQDAQRVPGAAGAAGAQTAQKALIDESAANVTQVNNNNHSSSNNSSSNNNVTQDGEDVTQSARELATGAKKCPTEMREGSGASGGASNRTSSSKTSSAAQNSSSSSKPLEHVQALTAENRRLKARQMCRACRKVDLSDSGITFLPCGHFITCESCSEMFDDCPSCGKNILGTVRTFLS